MSPKAAWVLWLIFGLALVVTGFEGSLGKVVACIFAPDVIVINS